MSDHHCGKMTDHAPHDWRARVFRIWYRCSGRRIHEGGFRGFNVRVSI